jgi:hypothetical protein
MHEYLDRMREPSIPGATFPVRAGDRYIAFFRTPEDEPLNFLTPETPANLRIVLEGVAEDWSDRVTPEHFPVGTIKPPHVDIR